MVGISGASTVITGLPRGPELGDALALANRTATGTDIAGLTRDLAQLARRAPIRAADAIDAARGGLTPVERGEFDRTLPLAIAEARRDAGLLSLVSDRTDELALLREGFPGAGIAALSALPSTDLAAPKADGVTASAEIGRNEVTWTLDAQGRPTTASATLADLRPSGIERGADELDAQDEVRERGLPDDDAGHIIGHRFMGDQGERNMFPQNFNFNRSAYKTMENEWASWIEHGATVKVNVALKGGDGARPDQVGVVYEVFHAGGKRVYKNAELFDNAAGQTFERASSADIRAMLGR